MTTGEVVQSVRGRPPADAGAPRGEEAVRAALIEAASDLFAERGPARVSVREVAASAGVNHGLVHHYFGSKDALLRAVLDDLAAHVADEVATWDGTDGLFATGQSTARHARITAYLLLDANNPAEVQTAFPAIDALVRELRRRGITEHEARARAAQVSALVLGWQLFEPFVVKAAGVRSRKRDQRALLADGVQRLVSRRGHTTTLNWHKLSTARERQSVGEVCGGGESDAEEGFVRLVRELGERLTQLVDGRAVRRRQAVRGRPGRSRRARPRWRRASCASRRPARRGTAGAGARD